MDIFNTIGNNPLIKLNYFSSAEVNIYAKFEGTNPGGSIKYRTTPYFMIKEGGKQGKLTKEKSILEATSENTGTSLVMIDAAKGYKAIFVISENTSKERIKILKYFGAFTINRTTIKKGNIVVIFPDRGERYFSAPVFSNNNKGDDYHEYIR